MSKHTPSHRDSAKRADHEAPGFYPPYKLILHRNPQIALLALVQAIRQITRYAEAEARNRMWELNHRGNTVVLATYFERAEFLAGKFEERGIPVTLEPA
jgi:ATP-dependent Clp protease adapter protein ClpS